MHAVAADDVDAALVFVGYRGAARERQWGQRFPRIGGRIVFPYVVDRQPAGRRRVRGRISAEHVYFAVERCQRGVMRGQYHVLFPGPLVCRGFVFEYQSLRRAIGVTAEYVEPAIGDYRIKLFAWFRKRCGLGPFA